MIGRWLDELASIWRRNRDEQLQWGAARQDDVAALRHKRAMQEQALIAELKKQSQQLAHELAVNQARNQTELAMVKTQCKQDLKDYQQYLKSLDQLKLSLRQSYAHLPEAVAFTIHHHAKQLLNRMWDADDHAEKLKSEMQLLHLMTLVHEDSQASLQGKAERVLPEKTLAFIEGEQSGEGL